MKKLKWGLFTLMVLVLGAIPMNAKAETITSASVTGIVEPVAGEKYSTAGVSVEPSLYTAEFDHWYKCNNGAICTDSSYMSSSELFVAGNYYMIFFTIKPTAGNSLSPYLAVYFNGNLATKYNIGSNIFYGIVFQEKYLTYTLSPSSNYTFPAQSVGYSTASSYQVTATNTGSANITLKASLSGDNASAFQMNNLGLNKPLGTSGAKAKGFFEVSTKTGLSPGTYTATVTVSGNNVESKSFNISFTVNASAPTGHSITVQNDGNGTASASPSSAVSGTQITLSATPNTGYQFKSWQVVSGGVSIANNKFTMGNSNVTVKAIFEPITTTTYTITVNGGSANKTKAGVNETINITANSAPAGKVFDKWTTSSGVTFASATSMSTTFKMPSKNVTVTATYKDLPAGSYAVNVTGGEGGTAYSNVNFAKPGDTVKLIVEESDGYMFKKWDIVSGPVTLDGDEFTMPANSVSLKALFEAIPGYIEEEPNDIDDAKEVEDSTEKKENKFNWKKVIISALVIAIACGSVTFIAIRKKAKSKNMKGGEEK